MFSPPPKTGRYNRPAPRRPFYRRSRFVYFALLLLLLYLWLTPPSFLYRAPVHAPSLRYKNVDWSLYAYSSFATSSAYLCNSVMLFEALARLGSKADRILFYPESWDLQISDSHDRDSQLLVKAKEEYNVKLIPTKMHKVGDESWNASFSKFLAWDQTQYDRVLHLDSDMTMYKHLDELFMLPSAQAAMPRAYWTLPEKKALSSKLVLIEPSHSEYERLLDTGRAAQRQGGTYDMDGLNGMYDDAALVLPHLRYGLTSGEFRSKEHERYLGRSGATWAPESVMKEVSLIHFRDYPLPKPWVMWPRNLLAEMVPVCEMQAKNKQDCRDKEIWMGLYDEFRQRRKILKVFTNIYSRDIPDRRLGMADARGALGGRLDSANNNVSVLNERRQSLMDLYLFGERCLNQLVAQSALVRPTVTIPAPKIWIIEPEDEDGVELSLPGTMGSLRNRLKDVEVPEYSLFKSIKDVSSCLVPAGFGTPVNVKPLVQPQFLYVPISDGGPGAELYDDALWGIRCSAWRQYANGVLPSIDDPFFVFQKHPASHIVLYQSPAVTVEEIHKSCAGAVYPGRVAVIEVSRLRRLGINIARCTDLMDIFFGPHIFANEEAKMRCNDPLTWWAETWVPRDAIFGWIGFSEFVQLCRNFSLVDRDNGPSDLQSFRRSRDDRNLFRKEIFAHVEDGIGASPSLAPPWLVFISTELEQAFLAQDGTFSITLQRSLIPTGTTGEVRSFGPDPHEDTLIGPVDPPVIPEPQPISGRHHDSNIQDDLFLEGLQMLFDGAVSFLSPFDTPQQEPEHLLETGEDLIDLRDPDDDLLGFSLP